MIRIAATILVLFFSIESDTVFAQTQTDSTQTPPAISQPTPPEFPVFLDNRELFRIRTGVLGYSAQTRASEISRRIEMLANDYSVPLEAITVGEGPMGTQIVAGDRFIFGVQDEDAGLSGKTRQELGKEYSEIVRGAVKQYRIDYSKKRIVRASALAILTTMILVLFIRALLRIHRRIIDRIQARAAERYGKILEDSQGKRVLDSVVAVLNFFRLILFGIVFVVYLQIVLGLLPWTRPFAGRILGYVLVPLQSLAQGFVAQIPNLFFVAVLAIIVHYALKIIHIIFNLIEVRRITIRGFDPEWSKPTYNIVRILVIAFALVVAFPYLPGSDSPAFKGVSLFIGILFSLGSSSSIANIIAGLSLTYRRAFRNGDLIRIGDVTGVVVSTRLSVTQVRTAKNELVTLPNSQIVNSNVVNYSSLSTQDGLILHTSVTIGYDVPWRQVQALLLMAAGITPDISKNPAPFVLQRELQDFYIKYELNAYTAEPTKMLKTYSALHQNIQDAFNEFGVQIMSPNYEADPGTPKVVPKEKWYEAPAKPE